MAKGGDSYLEGRVRVLVPVYCKICMVSKEVKDGPFLKTNWPVCLLIFLHAGNKKLADPKSSNCHNITIN